MQPSANPDVNAFKGSKASPNLQGQAQWETIRNTDSFKELIRQKRAFIIPATIFFLLFYLMLPVLTAFTTVLNGKVIGVVNWAYIYAFAQFVMTWALSHVYLKQAKRYDSLVAEIKREAAEKGVSLK